MCSSLKNIRVHLLPALLLYAQLFKQLVVVVLMPVDGVGPSGVRTLPIGAVLVRSIHCFCDHFSLLSFFCATYFSPEGFMLWV
jgi:hypothetical protein